MFVCDYNTYQRYYNPVAILGASFDGSHRGIKELDFGKARRLMGQIIFMRWEFLSEVDSCDDLAGDNCWIHY